MNIACTLRSEETVPLELKELLQEHYSRFLYSAGERFVNRRWKELETSSSLLYYRIVIDDVHAGWVVINGNTSTIKEFSLAKEFLGRGIESVVLDKIVGQHKLVSFELPKADSERYEILKLYGFRPTREFTFYQTPMMRMDLSTAVYLGKISTIQEVSYQEKEVVALEKIEDPQGDDAIKKGLENVMDKLGGLRQFVTKGQTVLLKPNLVSEHGLKDGITKGGITTDIRVVQSLVELLSPIAGKIIIAEGSSINRSETMKMFIHYGYDKIKDRFPEKVTLVDLNTDQCVEKSIPHGRRLEKRMVPKAIVDADVIINMPVLKLHFAAGASLSIKNLQGAIPPLEKYKVHFFGLWQNLINTYKVIMPDLIIIDGLYGQEDFGPVSGSPRKMDLLLGGTNPVAVDTVALKVMGLTVEDSPPVLMAYHEGLGPITEEQIDVRGPSIDEVSRPFKRPLINLTSGKCLKVHDGGACPGCKGYLHFVLNKLRRPDPLHHGQQLIDRPFEKNINIFIGPQTNSSIDPDEINIFMGICQQHHADSGGTHLPGCPPHAEEIINGIFQFYKDVEKVKYADKTEEAKLGELLKSILASLHNE
jgi:uncharacterized protein (DUF362 family)